MITLVCGIPGHGKTLFAVSSIAEEMARDGRPVYFHGIPECKVPGWKQLDDARQWFNLPPRSVVIIDEAHQVFPQRGPSAVVPEFVGMTAVLRRLGIDLVLITQDGNSIDHFVRRRCGRYLHLWRTMGLPRATVWEFGKFCDWEDSRSRAQAVRHQFAYPKAAFSLYKSAEVHTVKRRVPIKVLWLPVGALAIVGLVIFGYRTLIGGTVDRTAQEVKKITSSLPVASPGSGMVAGSARVSPQEYLQARLPRFPDMPESAPWFDALARPVAFPVVSGCLQTVSRCACYSQQGTRLSSVSTDLCERYVRHGSFNPFEHPRGTGRGSPRNELEARSSAGLAPVAGPGNRGEPPSAERRSGLVVLGASRTGAAR